MRKIIFSLLFTLYTMLSFGQQVQTVNSLALANSGSVTIALDQTTQLYWAYQGTYTLTGNLSIIYSGTPLIGTQFTIWFDSTTITPGPSYHVFILSQDFTSLLTGTQNLFITFTYNGNTWTSSCVPYAIAQAVAPLVSLTQLNDSLTNYTSQADVRSALTSYALLSGAAFSGTTTVPVVSNSDSSLNAANTAFVKRIFNTTLPSYATIAYTNSAISTSISSATTSITSAYTSAISTALQPYANPQSLDTLKAGTINLSSYVTGINNVVTPHIITGNIVLTANVFPGAISEITIALPFSGSYTVTAGANMSFTTITGANTHTSYLTLQWNPDQQIYIQKYFSQN